MKHWSHHSTEKYVIALLDLFNDMSIEYKTSDSTEYTNVPLKFRSRERAINLSEVETQEIIKGNTSIIPRMSLVINSIQKSPERTTNKYINSHTIKTDAGKKYTLNSVAYDWGFSLLLLTRTLTEATQVIEQIAPMFRPTYTININELDILEEPTTTLLDLEGIDFDIDDDHDDTDIRTITTEFTFTLRGNMYLPIQEQGLIEHMKIYVNNWFVDEDNEYEKSILIQQKGNLIDRSLEPIETIDLRPKVSNTDASVVPIVKDIIIYKGASDLTAKLNETVQLHGLISDLDNEGDEIQYIWSCTSGIISTNNYVVQYRGTVLGTSTISLVLKDAHGNQSLLFTKDIVVS